MLRLKGCQNFRQRLVLSTLTGRPIRIDDIRPGAQEPGLRDFEASLFRLLEKITTGCVVEINETGTSVRYKPGFIVGGEVLHDCGKSRGIGYFLEPLIMIALFGRKPLRITLRGNTNDKLDPGIDVFRTVTIPLLRSFTAVEELEDLQLKLHRRGCPPLGAGEVWLNVPVIKSLSYISRKEEGMVKRVRGVAYSARVSPQMSNRMVDGARGVLNRLLPDVFIFTDHASGGATGPSPGYGLTLVAETTAKNLISAETAADLSDKGRPQPWIAVGGLLSAENCSRTAQLAIEKTKEAEMLPEDVGRRAAYALLSQIHAGGVVDASHQGLAILLCALGPEEINEIRTGPLSPYAIRVLRNLKEFTGTTFSIRPETGSRTVFLSCIGLGVKNVARKAT